MAIGYGHICKSLNENSEPFSRNSVEFRENEMMGTGLDLSPKTFSCMNCNKAADYLHVDHKTFSKYTPVHGRTVPGHDPNGCTADREDLDPEVDG